MSPKQQGFVGNAGLLAYIVEKLQTWGDCKGDVESRFSMDEVSCRSPWILYYRVHVKDDNISWHPPMSTIVPSIKFEREIELRTLSGLLSNHLHL
jgi:hypothetical protein